MHHLYRLRTGFVVRFDVPPEQVEHSAVTSIDGQIHHVMTSEAEERKLFILQCQYLNAKYDQPLAA